MTLPLTSEHKCFCGEKPVITIVVNTIAGKATDNLCADHLVAVLEGQPRSKATDEVWAFVDGYKASKETRPEFVYQNLR